MAAKVVVARREHTRAANDAGFAAGGRSMSLRNRARSLQKKTGLSYQRALAKLRALGEKPARLAEQTGWPLDVCDRFLVDGHAPIDVIEVPERTTLREACEQICETLRVTANARTVVLCARNGSILARTGSLELDSIFVAAVDRGAHFTEP